ncbi:MAG: D-ribose pyranase [Anaerolineae bacterium]|nr:D-ribose pyranase [Anaerolineae bacterium]NUQ06082.1 D-ribose pyranase [Anaerolineae bacterium]
MKKTLLLNHPLSSVIASMGHTDMLVIADAGLPIPPDVERIDLALVAGMPPLIDVVKAVLGELQVERAIVASEMRERSRSMREALSDVLVHVPMSDVPHDEFKLLTRSARAVVRTGECTPYANVILVAGVVF